ncbi:MAG: Mu transposase C-terminal domain-containing protein [Elainellaceae cyanobacterium]
MLLEHRQDELTPQIERILWLDGSMTDVVIIDVNDVKALPVWRKAKDLILAVERREAHVLTADTYAGQLAPEDAIPEKHRQYRDAAWEIIEPLIGPDTEDIFSPKQRGLLFKAVQERTGCTKRTLYKYLRRYWQGGQTKNALLPHFDRCGAKGKTREAKNRKRGRPSKLAQVTKLPTGVNINDEIRAKFKRGIRLYYENPQQVPLSDAYQRTLERFFHKGYEKLSDGTLVPVLPPAHELPTLGQFRYWYEKERDATQALSSRKGKKRYQLSHREVLGDSTQMAFGPGSLYQIDATIGDVYLVSSLDRSRIIGRPVIYVVIDVFSRLIAGISVSLEGPSWLGAMAALENTAQDKVAFCQEYGIEITEEDWPSHHIPEAILADRGELEGYNADNLVNALNIRVANTPPFRADWKAIVERNFRLSNDKFIHWTPGAVYKPHERGDADYRLDATLDLHQFRKLMILSVLDHNRDHHMKWYRFDEFMIQDHVEPYPIDLWNWGIRNRAGSLRSVDMDMLRLNLLPGAEASVTYRGIRFQGLYYASDLALKEQWFVKARERGSWRIPVAYDPRKVDVLYLRLGDRHQVERCQLVDAEKPFRGRDWQEALDYQEVRKQATQLARSRKQQSKARFHAQADSIIKEAEQQTSAAQTGQSKRSRVKEIRKNRRQEKEAERDTQAWNIGAEERPKRPNLWLRAIALICSDDDLTRRYG